MLAAAMVLHDPAHLTLGDAVGGRDLLRRRSTQPRGHDPSVPALARGRIERLVAGLGPLLPLLAAAGERHRIGGIGTGIEV